MRLRLPYGPSFGLLLGVLLLAGRAGAQTYEATLSAPSDTEELLAFQVPPGSSTGTTHVLRAGASLQDAIDAAAPGDLILLGPGRYEGDIDFSGKALRIVGDRERTILAGSGAGPVVTFASGEGPGSILESVTVTGGSATQGGGIFIQGASPVIVRTVVTGNRATVAGSGVWITGAATPRLYNNLLTYNTSAGGDPHTIQVAGASPILVNNTIALGDSNGALIAGASQTRLVNNVFAHNGSQGRGRGICDFSSLASVIQYNAFYANRVAALLVGSVDWRRIERFQEGNPDPNVIGNVDGPPGFFRRPQRRADQSLPGDFGLFDRGRGAGAIDAGDPDPACNDLDGTRNDMGFTGGPYAPGSTRLPDAASCGASSS